VDRPWIKYEVFQSSTVRDEKSQTPSDIRLKTKLKQEERKEIKVIKLSEIKTKYGVQETAKKRAEPYNC
jgi:ribosomal protein S24E